MSQRADASRLITLRTLVSARWVLVAIVCALGVVFSSVLEMPGLHLLGSTRAVIAWYALAAAWALLNIVASKAITSERSQRSAGLQLVGDAIMLSALLALSGGAANPFTILYFVPIMLATQVSPRWTWGVASVCLVSFGLLFLAQPAQPPHSHFSGHLKGMWLAFAVSGMVMTIFVHRIAVAIAASRRELAVLRETALRDRQLAQLGSLAAGAAHELGTPLATMTVLVGELSAMDAVERRDAVAAIRTELFRCKEIIAAMANSELRADQLNASEIEPWTASGIEQEIDGDLEVSHVSDELPRVAVPRAVVVQIVRELVANARRSEPRSTIQLRIGADGEFARFTVTDDGRGMADDVAERATDPFYTTGDRDHMGLGLFLAEAQAHQLGGSLHIESRPGSGTSVSLLVPLVSVPAR